MDDLISEFLTETNESLDELDNDLVNLEQNPNDKPLLSKIFRVMHTIKGTCGFLGLPRLEKVAHNAENVLGRFRDGDLNVEPEYVTLIFESLDTIKMIVAHIGETGTEPDGDDSDLIVKLDSVYKGEGLPAEGESVQPEDIGETPIAETETKGGVDLSKMDDVNRALEEEIARVEADLAAQAERMKNEGCEDIEDEEEKEEEEQTLAPAAQTPKPAAAPAKQAEQKTTAKAPAAAPASTQTLRVNVDVLENLMTMVSELVLTRNQLLQILRTETDSAFSAPLQRLSHVVSDLQDGVMKTRMQPIGNAWSKLPRIIRDLSQELDKKIELVMSGQDTELDRQVLELIRDPLTHMVRNSADHGVETPEERLAAGKSETGHVYLDAYHEGGHIIIKIRDDGKGLSTEKIKQKVIENGVATAEELEEMSIQQIQQFIFDAGFSTAAKVTSVSGRGVGMDVVRTNIEKIGGSIELKSVEGEGSTFTIKIPLTLAIVSALIVEASGERFAIPQLVVRELVMTSDKDDSRIENIKGTPVFRLRDSLLPLVSLNEILKLNEVAALKEQILQEEKQELANHNNEHIFESLDNAAEDTTAEEYKPGPANALTHTHAKQGNQYIVVTQVGTYDFGIIVDRVFDTEEIVVKPVAKILRHIDLFSGNTILGDGTVIMILDPNGIAKATGDIESAEQTQAAHDNSLLTKKANEKTSLLLFSVGDKTPKAVPLSLVARLENVSSKNIERSGGQIMVQYRGQLMPLICMEGSGFDSPEGQEIDKPVLVFSDNGRSMGLVVDQIVDITEEHIDIQLAGTKPGLLGSAIIEGKATDVVDVAYYLQGSNQDWFEQDTVPFYGDASDNKGDRKKTTQKSGTKRHILLVDDSPFFRNMLTPLLSTAGYAVTAAESPIEALKLHDEGAEFDLIVSDIEMPEMDGFEFVKTLKAEGKWLNTPLVALTSHTTTQDIDHGLQSGFNKFIPKFDREHLLSTISETLSEQSQQADTSTAAE